MVVDDMVVHHVVVRVAAAGECEYEGRARHRRPSKPLHHHALPPDFQVFFSPCPGIPDERSNLETQREDARFPRKRASWGWVCGGTPQPAVTGPYTTARDGRPPSVPRPARPRRVAPPGRTTCEQRDDGPPSSPCTRWPGTTLPPPLPGGRAASGPR